MRKVFELPRNQQVFPEGGLERDFESPSLLALVLPSRRFKSRGRNHRNRLASSK